MELETRNAQLAEELSSAPRGRASASSADWLPRLPARHSLTGHRASVNRVAFHPLFSVLATASEDASVKVYDWETGEFERTLKGHTKAVQDVDFDSKGNFLGRSPITIILYWSGSIKPSRGARLEAGFEAGKGVWRRAAKVIR